MGSNPSHAARVVQLGLHARPFVIGRTSPYRVAAGHALGMRLSHLDGREAGSTPVAPASLGRQPRAPLAASDIFSSAWSIVKLAAF